MFLARPSQPQNHKRTAPPCLVALLQNRRSIQQSPLTAPTGRISCLDSNTHFVRVQSSPRTSAKAQRRHARAWPATAKLREGRRGNGRHTTAQRRNGNKAARGNVPQSNRNPSERGWRHDHNQVAGQRVLQIGYATKPVALARSNQGLSASSEPRKKSSRAAI